ncbi:lysylphosphatidylglycerol synthase transmembrane domain-containing protein [Listeria kieliensis]|uniref:Phosphatidylglycerol lysyltransferase n=1 Tax=Listeria kieliensis TaxID=1621700 RepID=A0A3D8TL26_9LIST|nr:lysylphosphatidylglycerol synthase transmembrane domain-containing protein [Listeria kieliensis]RDW99566.1 membrane protein [Listeria kieliensis]
MSKTAKRNWLNIFLILVISIGFLVWQFRDVNLKKFFEEMDQVNLWWILVAFLFMFLYWLFEGVVLHKSVKPSFEKQKFFSSFRITMIGQFFNTITPMQAGGQPAQLYALIKKGMDIGSASSVLLFKFIIYQAMIVINFLLILIFGFHYLMTGAVPQVKYLVVIGFAVHLFVIIALVLVGKSRGFTTRLVHILLKPIGWFLKQERVLKIETSIDEKIDTFHEESGRISRDWKLIVSASFYTTLQLWVYFAIPYFIMLGLGVTTMGLYMVITFHAFIMMFATVMPTPGGSGGAEYTFTLLFAPFLGSAKLLAALILWRIVTYYSCIVFGAIALMIQDKSLEAKKKTTSIPFEEKLS